MTPAAVITALLLKARAILYSGLPDRAWFTQQARVKAALTLPAAWLQERQVELGPERYQEIVGGILDTIAAHGRRPGQLGPYPCAYLHHCVERHLAHHGDEYYAEGKSIRNRLKLVMPAVEQASAGTVAVLAETHRATLAALKAGRRRPRAADPGPEPDLFAAPIAKLRSKSANSGSDC